MKFTQLDLQGMWLIEPRRYGDARGYFCETWRRDLFEQHCGAVDFVQDNESQSTLGVLRGLHYQRGAASQAKLVRVSSGRVLDVAVDLRRDSPTFGRWQALELDGESGRQLFVPRGFAHGFLVLSTTAQFQYKVDNYYDPSAELTIAYDDPTLAIAWPRIEGGYQLSQKDLRGLAWADAEKF